MRPVRSVLVLALFFFTVAPAAGAETWRWIDASGEVHYGASPPEGVTAEPVAERPAGLSTGRWESTAVVETPARRAETPASDDGAQALAVDAANLHRAKLGGYEFAVPVPEGWVPVPEEHLAILAEKAGTSTELFAGAFKPEGAQSFVAPWILIELEPREFQPAAMEALAESVRNPQVAAELEQSVQTSVGAGATLHTVRFDPSRSMLWIDYSEEEAGVRTSLARIFTTQGVVVVTGISDATDDGRFAGELRGLLSGVELSPSLTPRPARVRRAAAAPAADVATREPGGATGTLLGMLAALVTLLGWWVSNRGFASGVRTPVRIVAVLAGLGTIVGLGHGLDLHLRVTADAGGSFFYTLLAVALIGSVVGRLRARRAPAAPAEEEEGAGEAAAA